MSRFNDATHVQNLRCGQTVSGDAMATVSTTEMGTSAILEIYRDDVYSAPERAIHAGWKPLGPVMESVWIHLDAGNTKQEVKPEQLHRRMVEHLGEMQSA